MRIIFVFNSKCVRTTLDKVSSNSSLKNSQELVFKSTLRLQLRKYEYKYELVSFYVYLFCKFEYGIHHNFPWKFIYFGRTFEFQEVYS